MKLCVAQIKPVSGAVQRNIDQHRKLLALAITQGADVVVFPELSLTGYEPNLASQLATGQNDSRFDTFQQLADAHSLTIGIGAPTKSETGICISLIIFQPVKARQTYSKQYLHPDEEAFFVNAQRFSGLIGPEANIALAICYELSVPEHLANACKNGAEIYLASVAKSSEGVKKANEQLMAIARQKSMLVLMTNCIGPCDNFVGAGQSAIWTNTGTLAGQLNDTHEGILLVDTTTQEAMALYL
ncbi:carbon-nitrogen hydrolase family protein [Spirosoma spitsbergense]|uniref:carbon-nitrogen hydrolase family protein n=1 Tax=Spirosoma spitsbergense TaxID=431554 RepID=UPI00037F4878|nr:carbon-nitrogen hydrolase family protein [Spirosoma spitsbergense]